MEQNNNLIDKFEEQVFDNLGNLEDMTDKQLSAMIADENVMHDCELLAGYKEVATHELGRKPNPQKAWRRLTSRTKRHAQTISHPITNNSRVKRIWLAAAIIAFVTFVPMLYLQRVSQQDCPPKPVALRHDNRIIASQAVKASKDVIIYSKGEAGGKAGNTLADNHATITQTEANFSKVTASDISVSKTILIPRGKLYKVILSDGTTVWLNADSRLSFPSKFTGHERFVELTGEAYFRVTKDAKHPFIVQSGNVRTTVLGTEFNFRAYHNATPEIALVKGSVMVNNTANKHRVKLVPGQAATVSSDKIAVNNINAEYYSQWKEGIFYFDDTSLLDIMKELGRWYNVDIVIEDATLASYNIHFIANRDETLDQIISDLNFFSYLNVSKKGRKLLVSSKKSRK